MTKNGIIDGKCAMCGKGLRHGYTVIEEIERRRSVYGTEFLTNIG